MKNLFLVLMLSAAVFAACQVPKTPIGNNYAGLFEYGQELVITADCYSSENQIENAKTYYTKALENLKTAISYLNTGTDYELRANAYKKIGDAYIELAKIDSDNAETYNSNATEYYVMAQIELEKAPNYLLYIMGGAVAIIIILCFFAFRKKEYPEEYVKYAPEKRKEVSIDDFVKPVQKQAQQTLRTLDQKKEDIREKYKDRIRKKYGL